VALAAICLASFAAALLALDGLRRVEDDRARGRRTPGARLGRTGLKVAYSVALVVPYLAVPLAWALEAAPTAALLTFLTAPFAMRLGDTVSHRVGAPLAAAVSGTMLLGGAFLVLLAIGAAALPDP